MPLARLDRRRFLGVAAGLAFGRNLTSAAPRPVGSDILPEPDFDRVQGAIAGIRPYRRGSFRLEAEFFADRLVVHNYGHGGGGLTVAPGCAQEAVDLLALVHPSPREVAVLGAGVLGLSTASTLLDRGYSPVVYASAFTPNTTSDVAGGQWAASLVAVGRSDGERRRFHRIQRRSLEHYLSVLGHEYGVSKRDNYVEASRGSSVLSVPNDLLAPARRLPRLPFERVKSAGRIRETLLVEPPIYLPRVHADLRDRGVPFLTQTFAALDEVLALPQTVAVNCLGLGASEVFEDDRVVPVRGQLVLLEPQDLPWLLSHRRGYIFPRRDAVVLGGTVERGQAEAVTTASGRASILRDNREFFG